MNLKDAIVKSNLANRKDATLGTKFDPIDVQYLVECVEHDLPKYFELRDSCTFVPVAAFPITLNPLTKVAGYKERSIVLVKLQSSQLFLEPYQWDMKWMRDAHKYIQRCWVELHDGQLLDFRYIRGEQSAPCQSDLPKE